MSTDTFAQIATLAGVIVTTIGLVVVALLKSGSAPSLTSKSEPSDRAAEAALEQLVGSMVGDMRDDIARLRERVAALEAREQLWAGWTSELIQWGDAHGATNPPPPPAGLSNAIRDPRRS